MSQLSRDTVLSLAAILLVGGSAAVFNIAVGRGRGEEALGLAGLGLAVGLGGAQLVTAGLSPAITRFTALHLAEGDAARARRSLVGGLASSIALGLALAAALWYLAPRWAPRVGLPEGAVGLAVALLFLQSAYIAFKAGLYGAGRVPRYARLEVVAGIIFFIALLGLLLDPGRPALWPFIAANLVFVALALPLLWSPLAPSASTHAPAAIRPSSPAPDSHSMPRYALIATIGSAAALARLQLGLPVTGAFWPAAELGRLQAALTFLLPVMLVPRALELALLPTLAGDWGGADREAFRRRTAEALRLSALGITAVAGALALSGATIWPLLFGPEVVWSPGAFLSVLLAAWALGLSTPAVSALSGADGVMIPNLAGVAGLLVSLLTWGLLVPEQGAAGAAAGLAAGSLVNALIPMATIGRRYGIDLSPLRRLLLRSGLVFLLAALLVWRLPWLALPASAAFVAALLLGSGRRGRA